MDRSTKLKGCLDSSHCFFKEGVFLDKDRSQFPTSSSKVPHHLKQTDQFTKQQGSLGAAGKVQVRVLSRWAEVAGGKIGAVSNDELPPELF